MKRITLILSTCLLMLTACAQNTNTQTSTQSNVAKSESRESSLAMPSQATSQSNNQAMNKIVIFFSHAGDNYSVGNIEVGNTKIVADYISEITGAEQYEIVTHKYDGMAYTPLINLAQEEANKGELPPYEGATPDLSQYDTVFIGGPVWWGTYPQVMFTLFKDIDLSGKTVIPFTTHEGSGLANCVSDVKKAFPKANVTKGFSIYGHEVRTGKAKVEKWLKSL